MRSTVDAAATTGSGDATVRVLPPHATVTPASMSAAPARYMNERDMVSLEEGDRDGTRPDGGGAVKKKPHHSVRL